MKLDLGLQRHMLRRENFQFVKGQFSILKREAVEAAVPAWPAS